MNRASVPSSPSSAQASFAQVGQGGATPLIQVGRRSAPSPLLTVGVLVTALLVAAGCDAPRAHGDAHAIVVASNADLWDQVEQDVDDAVAPTVQVVRNERTFRVAWQDPTDRADWTHLRKFRNMVVIGASGEPWVDEVLAARRSDAPPVSGAEIVLVDNVWARGQTVTLVHLPASDDVAALTGLLDELSVVLDNQYREFARTRMYTSGPDTTLADSLATHVGFRLTLPSVYRYSVLDSVFRFRNDNPSPSELIREIGVTWVSPIPAELPDEAGIAAWRQAFADQYYSDAQVLDTTVTSFRTVAVAGSEETGVEFQASWASAPDAWPAGGPLFTRVIPCPAQDRLYFLDAWLYAPSREKYEYLIHLETILDTFECAGTQRMASSP